VQADLLVVLPQVDQAALAELEDEVVAVVVVDAVVMEDMLAVDAVVDGDIMVDVDHGVIAAGVGAGAGMAPVYGIQAGTGGWADRSSVIRYGKMASMVA
jgi:hypothetical protein